MKFVGFQLNDTATEPAPSGSVALLEAGTTEASAAVPHFPRGWKKPAHPAQEIPDPINPQDNAAAGSPITAAAAAPHGETAADTEPTSAETSLTVSAADGAAEEHGSAGSLALPENDTALIATAAVESALRQTHSAEECSEARQKAQYCAEVFDLAKAKKLPLQTACSMVATRAQEDFPALLGAGRGGKSALGETTAWTNYRQWVRKIGKLGARPNAENWRALLPQYRGSRAYARPGAAAFWTILARFYEHPNCLSLREAHKLSGIAFRHGGGADDQAPTIGQVQHYYDKFADQKAVLLARHGEEWFRNNVAGYIMREAPRVDECWFSDHHIFDAAVRVWDPATGKWCAVRPWISAWMDWGSLYYTGYVIRTISPNRDSIERALRLALEQNGRRPPKHLYIDNGKDYQAALKAAGKRSEVRSQKSAGEGGLSEEDRKRLDNVATQLGCAVHFAIPYNARAKLIERMFGTLCAHFSKLWTSYRGSNPTTRPETADEAWKHPESLPTLEQFSSAFAQWLAAIYHQTPGEGEILKGKSPLEVRAASGAPLRAALEPLEIYKAFLREVPGTREIMRGGMVRALNRWYRSEQLWQLKGRGEGVRVKVDPDNIAQAWIYTADGREIGPAQEVERLPGLIAGTEHATPETIEKLREAMKLQRRQINDSKRASAEQRGLPRWRALPTGDNANDVFQLPPASAAGPSFSAVRNAAAAPAVSAVDAALAGELDDALRADTSERLGRGEDERMDAGDQELLALIEAEQAARNT